MIFDSVSASHVDNQQAQWKEGLNHMNNKLHKICTLILALTILLALPLSASAAPLVTTSDAAATTGTLTITKAGSTFDLYKVATASVTAGASAYAYAPTTNYTGFFTGSYALTDSGIGAITANSASSQALATALENYIKAHTLSADVSGVTSGTATTLNIGYYLIVEKTTSSTTATVASKAMLVSIPEASGTVWDFTVNATLKDTAGDITKKIVEGENRVDANTAAIGDTISYEIISTVPDYDDSVVRSSIVYKITDTLSKGLNYKFATVAVTQNSATLVKDTDYTVSNTTNGDGTETLELVFNYASIEDKGTITVKYDATLTADASQTSAGNPNGVRLTYTNNPLETNDYYTKDDGVKTFTSGIAVKKVDPKNNTADMSGAEFVLKDSSNAVVGSYTYDASGNPVVTVGDAKTDADGMIYFPGLDAGTYTLTETKAPQGYHILDNPISIVIAAAKDGNNEPTGVFTCTVDTAGVSEVVSPSTAADKVFFNVQVENEAGWTLPGTGGMGTTLFTAGGVALIALSGILFLIARKRRSEKTK